MQFTYDAVGNVVQRSVTAGVAPQITRHPRAVVVAPGGSASFVVIASDTRGATYQWQLDSVAIVGATSSMLVISSASAGDEGQYTVTVTNSFGSITSTPAELLLDEDDNGLPDSWEVANGVNSTQQGHTDADNDGVSNLDEFFDGTDPTGSSSFLARLNITAEGGAVAPSPAGSVYPNGQSVALTATPSPGGTFYGWSGDVVGSTNPINISMNGNKSATAHFRCAPIPAGASAYWRGETDASDTIGSNTAQFYSGTTVVGPSLTSAGRIGNAFSFNGSLHVRGPMATGERPSEVTIELWVYPTLQNSSYQTLFQRGPYSLDLKNGKIQFWTSNAPTGQSHLVEGPVLPLNQWTHVAGVFGRDLKSLFVNGIPVASATGVTPLLYDSSASNFTIGASWAAGAVSTRLTGRVDEVGLYGRALFDSEVIQIASAGPAPKCGTPYFATPEALPDGITGTPYEQPLSVALSTPPTTFSLAVGGLPLGLTLSSSGVLGGTPSQAGEFSFIVRAIDSGGASGQQVYRVAIRAPQPAPESPRVSQRLQELGEWEPWQGRASTRQKYASELLGS